MLYLNYNERSSSRVEVGCSERRVGGLETVHGPAIYRVVAEFHPNKLERAVVRPPPPKT